MGEIRTISVSKGDGYMPHNRRKFKSANVDISRTHLNRVYVDVSLSEAYETLFGSAIRAYDEKQKRADRRIGSPAAYMKKVEASGNGERLFHELIVQIGDMYDSACGTQDGDRAATMLDEYAQSFQARNPRLQLIGMYLHLDEATPHLHIDFVPCADGYKTGMHCRNSMDRALKQQGVDPRGDNRMSNALIAWQDQERDALERIMNAHGWERAEHSGSTRKGLSIDQYRAQAEALTEEMNRHPAPHVSVDRKGRPKISAEEWLNIKKSLNLADSMRVIADEALKAADEEKRQAARDRADSNKRMRSVQSLEQQIPALESKIEQLKRYSDVVKADNDKLNDYAQSVEASVGSMDVLASLLDRLKHWKFSAPVQAIMNALTSVMEQIRAGFQLSESPSRGCDVQALATAAVEQGLPLSFRDLADDGTASLVAIGEKSSLVIASGLPDYASAQRLAPGVEITREVMTQRDREQSHPHRNKPQVKRRQSGWER